MTSCTICGDACAGADLAPLKNPALRWVWEQLAGAADRRGDADLTTGAITVTAPEEPAERAATIGLLGNRPLAPGQQRRIDLAVLTERLQVRGPHLTPGAAAAHALGRPLATSARARAERAAARNTIEAALADALAQYSDQASWALPGINSAWPYLRRSGWSARLLTVNEAALLVRTAVAVITHLPPRGNRLDRRQLASDHAHNPHALDEGTTLAGLVLALTTAAGATSTAQRTRDAWDSLGIDCDDLTGGLITVGIYPADWHLPPHAAITIPPRELISCKWPKASQSGDTVFVTENPSVASAAADLAREVTVRLVCTSGTPSEREVSAIARLAEAGWHTRIRADFDPAGLVHATTLLSGIPGATPWRMGTTDYKASLPRTQRVSFDPARVPETPWEPALAATMRSVGSAAFEEALMPQLLGDLRAAAGRKPRWSRRTRSL